MEAWAASLATFESWRPETLFLTHFGPSNPVSAHLGELRDHLEEMATVTRTSLSRDATDAERTALAPREHLAAVIHLCGPARGAAYVRHGFRMAPGEACGTHDLAAYLARVDRLTRSFERLARAA